MGTSTAAFKKLTVKTPGYTVGAKAFIKAGNKKIRNATKVEADGVKFDSQLEKYLYDLLKGAGIAFEFQKTYVLQEKFRYAGKAIRSVTLTVDFFLPGHGLIIDSKGFQTQQGAMRWKMLKHVLKHQHNVEPRIELPSTKKECELLINRLKFDKL